jgi:hypothetical protein
MGDAPAFWGIGSDMYTYTMHSSIDRREQGETALWLVCQCVASELTRGGADRPHVRERGLGLK